MRLAPWRDRAAASFAALVCSLLFCAVPWPLLSGLDLDLLTALRWRLAGSPPQAADVPTVVVAIDEQSYRTPPLEGSPTITWTREIGRVITALVDGGAAVVGVDLVFPSSIEQSQIPFGDGVVGSRLGGFDRDFLRALRAAASRGRLVLGEVQQGAQPLQPSAGQRIAVGGTAHIRALNVATDDDDVIRRVPLSFQTDGGRVPSMAVELAARALGLTPDHDAGGGVTLGRQRVQGRAPGTLTLNFAGGDRSASTYSFADLRACAERGDATYFRRQFQGKVVILGTLLDTEDRKLTTQRFATGREHAAAPRCALPADAAQDIGWAESRRSIAGVYIHATAVDNLLQDDAVHEPSAAWRLLMGLAVAALAARMALSWAPPVAVLGVLAGVVGHALASALLFRGGLALPVVEPALAAATTLAVVVGWRFMVAEREERFLRRSFALYLSPQVIDGMLDSGRLPALGGEEREITAFFSDIAGFSSFSEKLPPQALVTLMNRYLTEMTDIVQDEGGYVDKYVGDSIVALFGAPAHHEDHAVRAVSAALRCQRRLEELNAAGDAFLGHRLAHRIGLHSGRALVGNIGSERRFNYTAMSDSVNLASRLEGACKYFGTAILASEATVAQAGASQRWREIDAIRVKGREQPVRVFEPLPAGPAPAPRAHCERVYALGLAAWRRRDFAAAAACFASIAAVDAPAAAFERRASALSERPPDAGWEPVYTLEGK